MKTLKVKARQRNGKIYIPVYDHNIGDYVDLTPEQFSQLYQKQLKIDKSRKKILSESYNFGCNVKKTSKTSKKDKVKKLKRLKIWDKKTLKKLKFPK